MSQVVTKFIADNAVIGTKIRLNNNQPLRARNAANSADISLITLDASDHAQIAVALNVTGNITGTNLSGTNTGDVTLAAVGASPSANGASLSGQVLTLQPFDSTHPGVVTASGGGTTNFLRADGTWASPAGGTFANQQLSNLSGTVAINLDLIFDTGAPAFLKTKDDATTNTQALTIQSGDATGFQSGAVTVSSGTADTGQSGSMIFSSGNGAAADVPSGSVSILSGTASGTGSSGAIALNTGNVVSGASGAINIITGDTDATQNAGNIVLQPGNGGSPQAGKIQLNTGDPSAVGQVWTASDTSNSGYWATPAAAPSNEKQLFTLSGTDITNQYIDLDHVALTDSIDFLVKGGGIQIEGASYDYSVDYTGGAGGFTRITFLNDLATGGLSALIAGDVVVAKFQHA